MRHLFCLIGQPGSGKTTVVRAGLRGVASRQEFRPVPHLVYRDGIQLGVARWPFGGTDALPMNAQSAVLEWLGNGCKYQAVVAEGDRLANSKFFRAVQAQGWQLTVAMLSCPDALAARRRAQRGGSIQNPAWVKGRITKVCRLAAEWVPPGWWLDAARPAEELGEKLRQHPAFQALRGER